LIRAPAFAYEGHLSGVRQVGQGQWPHRSYVRPQPPRVDRALPRRRAHGRGRSGWTRSATARVAQGWPATSGGGTAAGRWAFRERSDRERRSARSG